MRDGPEDDLIHVLSEHRVLPLLDVDGAAGMDSLADVLVTENLPLIEVTLRRPGGANALRALATRRDLLVGAGTVMNARQAAAAVDAGAKFLVSPGFSRGVADEAARLAIPLIPGVATATELMAAIESGARIVKFFPAVTSGGPEAIRALSAVAPAVRWVPTGGVSPENAREYLDIDVVVAVGGSWITPRSAVESGRFDQVARRVRDAATLRT